MFNYEVTLFSVIITVIYLIPYSCIIIIVIIIIINSNNIIAVVAFFMILLRLYLR